MHHKYCETPLKQLLYTHISQLGVGITKTTDQKLANGTVISETKYIPPLFSVEVFLFLMFAFVLMSLISFCLLHWTSLGNRSAMEYDLEQKSTKQEKHGVDSIEEKQEEVQMITLYVFLYFS